VRLPRIEWRTAALKNGFLDAAAYRWEFLFEILGSAFVPAAIQLVIWHAMFTVNGAQTVGGMTYGQAIQYTLVSMMFTQVRGGNHDFELQEMIRSGGLSNYLLRPIGVVEFVYLRGIAPKIFTAAFALVIGAVVGWMFGLSPLNLLVAMFFAFAGNIIHYQISAALAATAFAWEEAYSILMVKNMLVSLLSGELIPLNLFPASFAWIWQWSPFYLYVYAPTRIASGEWPLSSLGPHLAWAAVWLLAGWLAIKATWGFGIRKYLSLGG
jgi:ABC-2 type transport system permease protein